MWYFVVGLGLVGAAALWWRMHRFPRTGRGMKQLAQKLVLGQSASQLFAERDELLARAPQMSEAELQAGVEVLFEGSPGQREDWKLAFEKVGRRAAPVLLRALDDPRCDSSRASEALEPDTAFQIITELLAGMGASEVISRLARWSNSADPDKRRHAIFCIAFTGMPGAVEKTRLALRSTEEKDRCWSLIGISRALQDGRGTEDYRLSIFPEVAAMATGETGFDSFDDRQSSDVLIRLDRSKGVETLTSRALRVENRRHLDSALKALNDHDVVLDARQLLPLLSHAKQEGQYPWTYVHAECLRALARSMPDLAKEEVEAALRSDEKEVRRGGVTALQTLLSVPGPYDIWDGKGELTDLPRPIQHVVAALWFRDQVENGGISQYFFNSYGDSCEVAMEAFRAMDAHNCVEILSKAIEFLGPEGTSPDRETRIRAYANLSDDKESFLDKLSGRFYKDEDRLEARIVRYMSKHSQVVRDAALAVARSRKKVS
jgi:hypothetical protein